MLIGNYNDYPHSKFLSTSNVIAGWQNEKVTNVRNFFALRSTNDALAVENAILRSQLAEYSQQAVYTFDSLAPSPLCSSASMLQFVPAKVVGLTLFDARNYVTINRGALDSIQVGQGVRTQEGVVGIVCTVNKHYSIVLPIIHIGSNLSCRFLKNDYLGSLTSKGYNPDFAYLEDVASHIPVMIGDTVVTSGLTPSFPEGIPVGVVEKVILEEGDSYYTIRVKLATDFRKLKYVEVIRDLEEEATYGVE